MVEVDKGVLEKLILFSIAIVVLPLGLLYGSLHGYLDPIILFLFGTVTENLRQVTGAVAAVLAVNMVVVAYCLSAWNEKPAKDPQKTE